jgi:hypothetical protein
MGHLTQALACSGRVRSPTPGDGAQPTTLPPEVGNMAGGRAPICGAPTDLGGGGALLRPQPSRSRSHTADGISTDRRRAP